MDYSDYDEEGWNLDEYNEMNEQAPEALPLETILEENSLMKDSPPQPVSSKQQTGHGRPASGTKTGKSATSKRVKSPSKTKTTMASSLKSNRMQQSPSGRCHPEMSEHERKLAEADGYLRKIQPTKNTLAKQRQMLLQKRDKVAALEREAELSQLSSWTG